MVLRSTRFGWMTFPFHTLFDVVMLVVVIVIIVCSYYVVHVSSCKIAMVSPCFINAIPMGQIFCNFLSVCFTMKEGATSKNLDSIMIHQSYIEEFINLCFVSVPPGDKRYEH